MKPRFYKKGYVLDWKPDHKHNLMVNTFVVYNSIVIVMS